MKGVQRGLVFPVAPASRDRRAATEQRKHLLIKGRPRRLRAAFPELSAADWQEIGLRLARGLPPEEACSPYADMPQIIKVAIPQAKLETLDRIRTRLDGSSTRPDVVRIAVLGFINRHEWIIGSVYSGPIEKRKTEPGRCVYIKVPFTPDTAGKIGHQAVRGEEDGAESIPASGLCAALGMTRQQVIMRAIDEFVEAMK